MKDAFENKIKESLENFEYQYNPKAWDTLNSKLDATPKGGKSPLKWYIAASVAAGLITVGYLYLSSDSTTTVNDNPNKELVAAKDTPITAVTQDNNPDLKSDERSNFTTQPDNASGNSENQQTNAPATQRANSQSGSGGSTGASAGSESVDHGSDRTATAGSGNQGNDAGISTPADLKEDSKTFVAPSISEVCTGSKILIKNDNAMYLAVEFPSGKRWLGNPNSSTSLFVSENGTYKVGYMDDSGNFVEKSAFNTLEAPKAYFSFNESDKPYDNGLPTVKVTTESNGEQFMWNTANEAAVGRNAEFHFFQDGSHEVKLTVTGSNGCRAEYARKVTIDNKYNLLAPNAFRPNSSDPKNNIFMPEALAERNANFQLIIIDPRDGHIVFESSDASIGWDGMDKHSGQMASYQTAYIWKVTILNPLPGENPVYNGTIIPLQN